MNKAKARRIYAITCKIESAVFQSECSSKTADYVEYLTQEIRTLLNGCLTDDEREVVIANYDDYFDKDGNIRPCSLIH